MRPSGYGGVSGMRDGDGGWMDDEGASDAGDWDRRAAQPAMGREALGGRARLGSRRCTVGEGVWTDVRAPGG